MRLARTKTLAAAAVVALGLTACGEAGEDGEGGTGNTEVEAPEWEVVENAADNFEEGSTMHEIATAGEVTIGVKYDQPGLGFQDAASDIPTGFDVEIAKMLAGQLGIAAEDVTWEETISDNREPYLQQERVDMVLATYSITDERREIVGQTGPYLVTGQQVLVAADSDVESIDDLEGEEVCASDGSTSLANIEESGAVAVPSGGYSECVEDLLNGSIAAVSTDGAILLGYAAQNEGELKVVGPEFSEERIGVGYSIDSSDMCQFINDSLEASFEDGNWDQAYQYTLGGEDVETPEIPELDACSA